MNTGSASARWLVLGLCLGSVAAAGPDARLEHFQELARKQGMVLQVPAYATSPDEVTAQTDRALARAESGLAAIAAQDTTKLTFRGTFAALDAVAGELTDFAGTLDLVSETSTDKAVRDAARAMSVRISTWTVGLDYREDVYRALKAFADTRPALAADEQRLLDFQMRDYRRAGLALPPDERALVEEKRKELAATMTEFSTNINEARAPLDFTGGELEGVPQGFLDSPGVRQEDGTYRVMANTTWHAQAVMENALRPDVRERVYLARNRLARETNVEVLTRMVTLRADIARRLGYATWADYQIETRMAKNGATALQFEEDLVARLQPKFAAEMETLRQIKAARTGKDDAVIEPWDVAYYTNLLRKERYAVDAEALRVFFPYTAVLQGMFDVYQRIFGLTFAEVAPPHAWAEGVRLFVVLDAATSTPMGLFHLDMFPRDGKYNHFACFPQQSGRVLADGTFELPLATLVCNFTPATTERPSLLRHDEVETLFHEFGHVMHCMLSRARFARQTPNGVPRDFIEAPSQMLENWVWDKTVLDTFAADYRDPAKKIPAETIVALDRARQATAGLFYRRQLSLGLIDLTLHTWQAGSGPLDVVAVTNAVTARVHVAPAPDTAFVAYFGHLAGYDAGYYGYLWAEVISCDMAGVFQAAPGGFLDEKAGRRLRDEIYAVGDTRDASDSVAAFIGRPRSMEAFLRQAGLP